MSPEDKRPFSLYKRRVTRRFLWSKLQGCVKSNAGAVAVRGPLCLFTMCKFRWKLRAVSGVQLVSAISWTNRPINLTHSDCRSCRWRNSFRVGSEPTIFKFHTRSFPARRSQWSRVLRRGSAASRLLGLWFRIPPNNIDVCLLRVVRWQVAGSASGWSLF